METQNNNIKLEEGTETHAISQYLILTVVAFIVGGVVGVLADPYLPASLSNSKKGYQVGFSAARTLVEKSALGNFFKTQSDVRSIPGTVTSIDGNRITIQGQSANNPFDGPALNTRTVIIDTNTKVIKLSKKDSATIQAEMNAFIKALKTKTATSSPVALSAEPYIQTVVNSSSIQAGDLVTVTAGENIKNQAQFTATLIQIQPNVLAK